VVALKEVSSFATLLLSQIPLQGIELYLGFWSGRFPFILVVCWGSVLATTQLFECCQQEGKAGVGFLHQRPENVEVRLLCHTLQHFCLHFVTRV
jgi:hypothetical protein